MKTFKLFSTLGIAVLLAACSANQEVVSIEEYDDLYYSGTRNNPIANVPQTEIASAYSGTGSAAELSYYQNQPYDYGVDPVQTPKNNESSGNQDSSTQPEVVYSEEDYYDADYAADYNNFHTVGVGQNFSTQNNAPNVNMSLGYNSFGGNSMWGMGMSYGSPMWGNPWMGNSMGMGMGMGMGGFCPPFGSPFYDPWCSPWGWNSPFAGPAWRWGWSANFGWGGNPWMNPYCMSGMGNPWMSPFGPNSYNPYGFNPYGYNPYGPIYNSPNPWDGGTTQPGNIGASNNGRTQRGGVISPPVGETGGSDDGRRGIINEASSGTSTNTRSGAARSIVPNTIKDSEAAGVNIIRQGGDNRSTAPASRINQNNVNAEQSTKGQQNRSNQVLSPYVRQQNTKSPTEGGSINRGSAPRSQPVRQHHNQPSYSPPSMPSNAPSPSYSPQRSGGSTGGGNSGSGGSVSPTRRR